MNKLRDLLSKTLVVGVIGLFLGISVQPAFASVQPENIDVEYFDVTTEFIGLGKEYTTQLTKEEIEELDALFDIIFYRINNSKSYSENVELFKESIFKLDSYGLLGNVGIDETEKLVTNCYQRTILMKTLERLINRKMGILGEDENRFCLIVGKVEGAVFISQMFWKIFMFLMDYFHSWIMAVVMAVVFNLWTYHILIPFCLGRFICISDNNDAKGKIISFGLNGLKSWNGTLKGKMEFENVLDIGVLGFIGLKIEIVTQPNQYFIGFATQVHIEDS